MAIERHYGMRASQEAEARAEAARNELAEVVGTERELRAKAEQRAAAAAEFAA